MAKKNSTETVTANSVTLQTVKPAKAPRTKKPVLTTEERHALQAKAKASLLPDYKYRMVLSGRDIEVLLQALHGMTAGPELEAAVGRLVKRGYR